MIKKLVLSGFAAMAILFAAGCGDSPQTTAKVFLENLSKGNVTVAKKYATEQTGEFIDAVVEMDKLEINPDFKFIFIDETVDGDFAVIRYKSSGNATNEIKALHLVKTNSQWKVTIQKDQ
ncbi:MAG: hypothetical protein WC959_11650 [Kiritimatiellales bacterium]